MRQQNVGKVCFGAGKVYKVAFITVSAVFVQATGELESIKVPCVNILRLFSHFGFFKDQSVKNAQCIYIFFRKVPVFQSSLGDNSSSPRFQVSPELQQPTLRLLYRRQRSSMDTRSDPLSNKVPSSKVRYLLQVNEAHESSRN